MTLVITGKTSVELKNDPQPRHFTESQDLVDLPVARPVSARGRDAYFDPAAMVVDQGYSYRLDGDEYMAVLRADGRVDIYSLPDR